MKPHIRSIFLLRCPYCVTSPLLESGKWFEFREGCPVCSYRYEREGGYFIGAPWMISYPIVGIICLAASVYFYPIFAERYGMLLLSTFIAVLAIVSALIFYPFARAIWLVGDHIMNPLEERERTFHPTATPP